MNQGKLINRLHSQMFEKSLKIMSKVKRIDSSIALLSWDQETYMPIGSTEYRADCIGTLTELRSEIIKSKENLDILDKIKKNIDKMEFFEKRVLELYIKECEKVLKIPTDLLINLSIQKSKTTEVWKLAKKENDYVSYSKELEKLVEMSKEEANIISDGKSTYDTLLNIYEEGIDSNILANWFDELKPILKKFINEKYSSETKTPHFQMNIDDEISLSEYVGKKIGFDNHYGRFDISTHPFTTSFSMKDVRITSRYDINRPLKGLSGYIHEVGHALYEQNIDVSLIDTFGAEGSSYGIHESQSLFWENIICKSRNFIKFLLNNESTSKYFNGIDEDTLFTYLNKIQPGLTRIEADEVTYIYHIIIRFEIEKLIFNNKIRIKDIPEKWNELYKSYLGVVVPNDSAGVLQDIHWSIGAFGYFPSYALGKIYSTSILKKIKSELTNFDELVMNGEFDEIKYWLSSKIHKYGKTLTPQELFLKNDIDFNHVNNYKEYLEEKYK